MEKKSVQDLRAELKVLREGSKEHMPVSKLRKADVSELIAKMKSHTMTTPAAAMMKKTTKMPKDEVVKMPVEPKMKMSHKKHDGYTEVQEDMHIKKAKAPVQNVAKPKESMKEKMAKLRAMKK
jgi:hypothetical protein